MSTLPLSATSPRVEHPYVKLQTSYGQKTISFLGPKLSNNFLMPAAVKFSTIVNTFKHEIKKLFFSQLQKRK